MSEPALYIFIGIMATGYILFLFAMVKVVSKMSVQHGTKVVKVEIPDDQDIDGLDWYTTRRERNGKPVYEFPQADE